MSRRILGAGTGDPLVQSIRKGGPDFCCGLARIGWRYCERFGPCREFRLYLDFFSNKHVWCPRNSVPPRNLLTLAGGTEVLQASYNQKEHHNHRQDQSDPDDGAMPLAPGTQLLRLFHG